jgi:hypothetical protein
MSGSGTGHLSLFDVTKNVIKITQKTTILMSSQKWQGFTTLLISLYCIQLVSLVDCKEYPGIMINNMEGFGNNRYMTGT